MTWCKTACPEFPHSSTRRFCRSHKSRRNAESLSFPSGRLSQRRSCLGSLTMLRVADLPDARLRDSSRCPSRGERTSFSSFSHAHPFSLLVFSILFLRASPAPSGCQSPFPSFPPSLLSSCVQPCFLLSILHHDCIEEDDFSRSISTLVDVSLGFPGPEGKSEEKR